MSLYQQGVSDLIKRECIIWFIVNLLVKIPSSTQHAAGCLVRRCCRRHCLVLPPAGRHASQQLQQRVRLGYCTREELYRGSSNRSVAYVRGMMIADHSCCCCCCCTAYLLSCPATATAAPLTLRPAQSPSTQQPDSVTAVA